MLHVAVCLKTRRSLVFPNGIYVKNQVISVTFFVFLNNCIIMFIIFYPLNGLAKTFRTNYIICSLFLFAFEVL